MILGGFTMSAEQPAASSSSPRGGESDPLPSTRERLLEVAGQLFAERGYSGASLGEIANRLGIRKPSLYNHIASKDELFMELLERSLDAWQAASDSPLDGAGSAHRRLRRHLQKTVDFAVESPHATALCRLAVSQVSGDLAERASALLLRHRLEYQGVMERFFREAIEGGELATGMADCNADDGPARRSTMAEILTFSWLTFLDGILMHQVFALGSRREVYLDRLDDLWQVFWRGCVGAGDVSDG